RAIRQLILLDYISAVAAWLTFWVYRHELLRQQGFVGTLHLFQLRDYIAGIVVVPVGWLFLYLLSGTYFDLYRKSRLNEINRTLISCIIGSIFISLFVFANYATDYSYFIKTTANYLIIHTAYTLV